MSQYNSTTATWVSLINTTSTADWVINASLDSTGGKNIPVNYLYTQIGFDGTNQAPLQTFYRATSGASVFTGTNLIANMSWAPSTTYTVDVMVSAAGSTALDGTYTVTFNTPS